MTRALPFHGFWMLFGVELEREACSDVKEMGKREQR